MAITIKELFDRLPDAFIPEKAEGVEAVIQFALTGDEASNWIIDIKEGGVSVTEGEHEDPTMTLGADSDLYKDIVTGRTNAMSAFMQGKVTLKGNMNLAMKFVEMFKLS